MARPRRSPCILFAALILASFIPAMKADELAQTVSFQSADGRTQLTGYVFLPVERARLASAVLMMHGRSGAYSSNANGLYNASTLSLRHLLWGEFWTERGVAALLVDGFGSRGFRAGFPRGSYAEAPGHG